MKPSRIAGNLTKAIERPIRYQMGVSAGSLTELIEGELSVLKDPRVINHIRGLLVPPEPQMRAWDYGNPGDAYPCWLVLADTSSNAGIAYCEYGFGPSTPWGLVSVQGQYMSMGMDSGWFKYFLDAYFESAPSTYLPIWRVFEGGFPGTPITDEDTYDATWAVVMRLRSETPQLQFQLRAKCICE
jgi:hypothetical protein